MGNTVTSNIKQAICSKSFLAGVFSFAFLVFISSFENILKEFETKGLLPTEFHGKIIIDAMSSDTMILAIPIICALPYTASFVDDIKSGFLKSYISRTTKREYITGKLAGCILSGGLVLMLGILLSYAVSALIFIPMEAALAEGEISSRCHIEIFGSALLAFFSGSLWSLAGFTVASLTMNKYMAYASPFIFYYILIILKERYFYDMYVIYPKEWLNPSDFWVMGSFGVILLLCAVMYVLCLVFRITAERRFKDG